MVERIPPVLFLKIFRNNPFSLVQKPLTIYTNPAQIVLYIVVWLFSPNDGNIALTKGLGAFPAPPARKKQKGDYTMENYSIYWADGKTNEDLIAALIADNNNSLVFEELIRRLRPVILGEAQAYRSQLPYDTDDYLQEGRIVLWKIAAKGTFKPGNFRNFFISVIRFHLRHLYRDYVLHNMIQIGGYEDCRGQAYQILIEAPFAARFRERHRIHCRESYHRRKAREAEERTQLGIPAPAPKSKLSEEERRERNRARSLAYYYAHADEMNARAKAKRAAAKAARPTSTTIL